MIYKIVLIGVVLDYLRPFDTATYDVDAMRPAYLFLIFVTCCKQNHDWL